jgi:hypothetical protein
MIFGFMVYADHVKYGDLLNMPHHRTYSTDHQMTSVNPNGITYT